MLVRFGTEPERVGSGEKPVVKFSGGIKRRFCKEGDPDTDWFDFVAFANTAEFVEKYFKKGSRALVTATVQNSYWTDKEGKQRKNVQFIVDKIEFVESKPKDENSATTSSATATSAPAKAEPKKAEAPSAPVDDLNNFMGLGDEIAF